MKANTENFRDIFFRNELFTVPFFQRKYVWTESEWKRCLDDVRQAAAENIPHFMGSLIFKTEPRGPVLDNTIIDGQQRATTLSILYYVLCKKYNRLERLSQCFELAPEEYKFSHTYMDKQVFEWIIYQNCDPAKADANMEDHQLYQCKEFFEQELENDELVLPDTVEEQLYFVTITLDPSDDEQAIFETINSLGVELTTAELLKNDLFRNETPDFFKKTWGSIFESVFIKNYWSESVTCGKHDTANHLDVFLRAYYDIVAEHTSEYKKFSSLFKLYQEHIAHHAPDKHAFIEDLTQTAELYRKSFARELIDFEIRDISPLSRICLLIMAVQRTQIIPYVLYVQKNAEPEEAEKIFHLLETYIIRRWICNFSTARYNLQFKSLISYKLITYDSLLAKINENEDDTSRMPTAKEVWTAIVTGARKVTMNKLAKVLLFFLELHLRKQHQPRRNLTAYNICELEYLMPKNLDNWPALKNIAAENPEYMKRLHAKLGNLSLANKKIPASVSADTWQKKVENGLIDQCANFYSTAPYLEWPEWNIDAINARTSDLANVILEIWDYELDNKETNISINRSNLNSGIHHLAKLEKNKQPYEIMLLQKYIDPELTEFRMQAQSALLRTIEEVEKQMLKTSAVDMDDADSLKFYRLNEKNFTGTKPAHFKFLDTYYECSGWKDFLMQSLQCFLQYYPEQMKRICISDTVSNLTTTIPTKYQNTNRWAQINDFCAVRFHLPAESQIDIVRNIAAYLDMPGDAITVSLKKMDKKR